MENGSKKRNILDEPEKQMQKKKSSKTIKPQGNELDGQSKKPAVE